MNVDLSFLSLVFPAFVALVGFPACVAALINLAKKFGLPDGAAPDVSMFFNMIGFIGVFYLIFTGKADLLSALDVQLGILATFLVSFTTFVVEVGLTKVFHQALRGLPYIGYSYSLKAKKK